MQDRHFKLQNDYKLQNQIRQRSTTKKQRSYLLTKNENAYYSYIKQTALATID